MKYKFLDHTSEIKFVAQGKTLNNAFESVVLAISNFLSKDQNIKPTKTISISIKGDNIENLLYNFIDEIIYLYDAKNFLVSSAKVSIKHLTLKANFKGDDSTKYKGLDHIKAPTYSEMFIKNKNNSWTIQVVLDI